MKRMYRNLGFALHGLEHAVTTERNLRIFLATYVLVLLAGETLHINPAQWTSLILSGGLFMTTELINTALERLVDTCDEIWRKVDTNASGHHHGLKMTKDVASAASLISLIVNIIVILSIFLPMIGR